MALRAAGRDFVVAPLPSRTGEPLALLTEPFAVTFVAGASFDEETATEQHGRVVLDLLVAVHTAPPQVAALARVDDYAIQARETLDRAAGAVTGRSARGGLTRNRPGTLRPAGRGPAHHPCPRRTRSPGPV